MTSHAFIALDRRHRRREILGTLINAMLAFGLVVFAAVYLSFGPGSGRHFSEPLDHTGALYLTITVFSTVGFGDITPESNLARLVVSIQMLLDLVVIGVVVRLIATAAKSGSKIKAAIDGDAT